MGVQCINIMHCAIFWLCYFNIESFINDIISYFLCILSTVSTNQIYNIPVMRFGHVLLGHCHVVE
jgi:hypothetical protein